MISDVMWPDIRGLIESITKTQGIQLPASCGIDADSTMIKVDAGRIGVAVDLNLANFDAAKCLQLLKNGLPKLPSGLAAKRRRRKRNPS